MDMKILIAEDDVISRAMLAAVLKKWGFDPVVTEDGSAAWQAMQTPDAPPRRRSEKYPLFSAMAVTPQPRLDLSNKKLPIKMIATGMACYQSGLGITG
jgi:CheY-like chemotaxis protein